MSLSQWYHWKYRASSEAYQFQAEISFPMMGKKKKKSALREKTNTA